MLRCVRPVVLSLLLSLLCSPALAQSTTSLHGVISDAKGAVLPGAAVKINDPQTGFTRTVASGADGVYQLLQVPPATYNVEVTAPGFAPVKRQNVTLLVSTPATLNITLQVRGVLEQVEKPPLAGIAGVGAYRPVGEHAHLDRRPRRPGPRRRPRRRRWGPPR